MKKQYKQFMKQTLKANRKLSYYIKNKIKKVDYENINNIGFGGDETKRIDFIAEKIFVKYLIKFGDILSEESGLIKSNKTSKKYFFRNSLIIIDPLDGSDNFLSSFPYFGTSISLCIDDMAVIGCVYNLVTNTYIFKTKYKTNIQSNSLSKSSFGIFERAYTTPYIVEKLKENNLKFRSPGATAISLANAHQYQFVLLAGKPRRFDIDAGLLICKDLNIYQNGNFLLVSKDVLIFEIIKDIIKDY